MSGQGSGLHVQATLSLQKTRIYNFNIFKLGTKIINILLNNNKLFRFEWMDDIHDGMNSIGRQKCDKNIYRNVCARAVKTSIISIKVF